MEDQKQLNELGYTDEEWERQMRKDAFFGPKDILEIRALQFATMAHEGQKRKYTGEPYINHPIAVAELVRSAGGTPAMIAAAYLHDVVEDCGVSHSDIGAEFGGAVGTLVYYLTDASIGMTGNRKARKEIDRAKLAKAPAAAKTIKLADLIDNTKTISERDPEFWKVYREEKRLLLDVLQDGDRGLWKQAALQCA